MASKTEIGSDASSEGPVVKVSGWVSVECAATGPYSVGTRRTTLADLERFIAALRAEGAQDDQPVDNAGFMSARIERPVLRHRDEIVGSGSVQMGCQWTDADQKRTGAPCPRCGHQSYTHKLMGHPRRIDCLACQGVM